MISKKESIMKNPLTLIKTVCFTFIIILIYNIPCVIDAEEIDEKYLPYIFTKSDFSGYDYKLVDQRKDSCEIAEGVWYPGVEQYWISPEGIESIIGVRLFIFNSISEAAKGTKYFADIGTGVNRWGSKTGSIAGDEYWYKDSSQSVKAIVNNIGFEFLFPATIPNAAYTDLLTKLIQKIQSNVDPAILSSMEQAKQSQITKEQYNQLVLTLPGSELMTDYELFAERDSKWVIDMNGFAMGRRTEWKKENGELIGIDICEFETEEAAQSAIDFK